MHSEEHAMVTVTVGQAEMQMDNIDESWINQQLSRRQADGRSVCVQVRIHTGDVNVALATPQCAGGGGGGRQATQREQPILDEWAKHRLNTMDYSGGQLLAFLRALRRMT
jgi:hypothetical protein